MSASDAGRHLHETWRGMVQPIEGLVGSVPVLVDAQCAVRQPAALRERLLELRPPAAEGGGDAAGPGARCPLLLRDLPDGLDLDRPETATGPWEYPPAAKLDRLLPARRRARPGRGGTRRGRRGDPASM